MFIHFYTYRHFVSQVKIQLYASVGTYTFLYASGDRPDSILFYLFLMAPASIIIRLKIEPFSQYFIKITVSLFNIYIVKVFILVKELGSYCCNQFYCMLGKYVEI